MGSAQSSSASDSVGTSAAFSMSYLEQQLAKDSFYRGLSPEESEHVHEYNFDHPDAFDTEQLLECVEKLKSGQPIHVPIYDFKTQQRSSDNFRQVNASDVIILEGILVFHDQRVRNLMNMKIFVDTDADVRLAYKIRRDIVEMDLQGVITKMNPEVVKSVIGNGSLGTSRSAVSVLSPSNNLSHLSVFDPKLSLRCGGDENGVTRAPMTIFYNGTVSVFDVSSPLVLSLSLNFSLLPQLHGVECF